MESEKLNQEITLEQLLELNNIKKIDDTQFLMDTKNLDKDNMPKILTTKTSIIIFDNSIFNSTYLIDLINEFINDNQNSLNPIGINNIDIFYCDSVIERLRVTRPDINGVKEIDAVNGDITKLSPVHIDTIEKKLLHPGFIFINPNINHIGIIEEGWIPFNAGNIKDLFVLVESNMDSKADDRKAQVVVKSEEIKK